jgi:hypothetical protein
LSCLNHCFRTIQLLNRHRKEVHGEKKNTQCSICQKEFTTGWSMLRHKRDAHEKMLSK